MRTLIAPSILSADFSKMGEEIKRVERAGADLIHCDVMDGIFVPNITFGPKMIADIKKVTDLKLDVHLMITEPERYVDNFLDAGADILTIHYESTKNVLQTLKAINERGVMSGIVISPQTEVEVLEKFIPHVGLVLIMSVHPGFGGQKFIPDALSKLNKLRKLVNELNPAVLIEVDGGITAQTAQDAVNAGADILVAGNTVFSSSDLSATFTALRIKK